MNWYVYCNNNPVSFIDPSGLMSNDMYDLYFLASTDLYIDAAFDSYMRNSSNIGQVDPSWVATAWAQWLSFFDTYSCPISGTNKNVLPESFIQASITNAVKTMYNINYNVNNTVLMNYVKGLVKFGLDSNGNAKSPQARPGLASFSEPNFPFYRIDGNYSGQFHGGADFPLGNKSDVFSAFDGIVTAVVNLTNSYGNYIVIESLVNRVVYQVYYAHLNMIDAKVGDFVKAGAIIGLSGNSGGNSTKPLPYHLHFEIREYPFKHVSTDTVDPSIFFKSKY